MSGQPCQTRKEFLQAVSGLGRRPSQAGPQNLPPKVLLVVAHPDDEYVFAATVYRIVSELGGIVDQAVITNGAGGYRYAALAEPIYGVCLTHEAEGRLLLPSIRREETLRAGRILGVRRHYFLNQKDVGFEGNAADAEAANWDSRHVLSYIGGLLQRERYGFVFTLLPTADTHGHHRAATLLALEAVTRMAEAGRPAVLGAEPGGERTNFTRFAGLKAHPITRTVDDAPILIFDSRSSFGYRQALNYHVVVNWVIAEHKSQGLFQSDYGRHDLERFWLFAVSGREALSRTCHLAGSLGVSNRQNEAALEIGVQTWNFLSAS